MSHADGQRLQPLLCSTDQRVRWGAGVADHGKDWVVLVETMSNQPFIFGSVRLVENVGASQLIHDAGTRIAREVLAGIAATEAVLCTSGRVLVACDSEATAKAVVTEVSSRWLREVPGIGIAAGVASGYAARPHAAVAEVHRLAAANASPAMARFQRLPIIEPCASTAYPAATLVALGGQKPKVPTSTIAAAKRAAAAAGIKRFGELLHGHRGVCRNLGELEALGLEDQWVGVVHIDGNGLGKVFLDFGKDPTTGEERYDGTEYAVALSAFSRAVDGVTVGAATDALDELEAAGLLAAHGAMGDPMPFVPLVLGGDDVTLICDGRLAIPFTRSFLVAFEKRAAESLELRDHLDGMRLTACGGVAIAKAHFPFHGAYDLAEELLASAKKVKTRVVDSAAGAFAPCSALDFHVLHDSTFSTLADIVDRSATDEGTVALRSGPYLVTDPDPAIGLTGETRAWMDEHQFDALASRSELLRTLGTGIAHDLRTAASLGRQEAEAAHERLAQRAASLRNADRAKALSDLGDLYVDTTGSPATWLIDALDLARFGAVT
jgi:hypothetical protein